MATTASPAKVSALSAAELAEYLVDIGATLLSYGCPTHRLEAVIREIGALEGCQADAFAVPTGLWLSLSGPSVEQPIVRMVRVKEWAVDLNRLAAVDRIFNEVLERRITLAEARRKLDDVETMPSPYPAALRRLASAACAAAAAIFFRGGPAEVAVAGLGGLLVGLLGTGLSPRARLLNDFLGGLVAGLIAWGATILEPTLSREVIVLACVIQLVPGMALTTGLAELAHKNLVSGASRLMEALIIFLSILFGIAVVFGVEQSLGLTPGPPVARGSMPLGANLVALVAASAAFSVLFHVPRRFLGWAMVTCAIGWLVTGFGVRWLPGGLAAFGAALSANLWANVCARVSKRPAQVFLLPGLVLLVPGSFGFLSLEAFLRGEFLGGAAKGFEMFLVSGAIVTGLLVANVVLPARKLL